VYKELVYIINMNIGFVYLVSVEDRLTSFLKESKNWERRSTNIRGVFY